MNLIEQKIKQLFIKKELFCKSQGYKFKDFASKMRTFESKLNWLNKFLEPLNLTIKIVESDNNR